MINENPEIQIDVFRHEKAEYKLNKKVLNSDNPQNPVKASDQDFTHDLTPEGIERAKKEASAYFDSPKLNPQKNAFFVVSSDFVRTTNTAAIYIEEATRRGYEIIAPEKPGSEIVDKAGEGKVKHAYNLSLHINNALLDQICSPNNDYLQLAKERGVIFDPEFEEKWKSARTIIEKNKKDTWSENWQAHSDEIKAIFPEFKTAEDMYETQFRNMIRLMSFAKKKMEESGHEKNIRILAFTHENLFTYWLAEKFGEPGLKQGECVSFTFKDDGKLRAKVRGKEAVEEIKT